jgi:hypothetical protein
MCYKKGYKYIIFQDEIKQSAYRYFSHRPTDTFISTEIKGIQVSINRDVVDDRVYFTAKFIWEDVLREFYF